MLSEIFGVIKVVRYEENRVVFRQGDDGTCWYIVLVGEVKVIKEMGANSLVLANLTAGKKTATPLMCTRIQICNIYLLLGDGFGEVALVNDSKRSATVLSSTKCLLLQLEKNEYNRIVK
jgi:CRP-like cAMP-binding protein